MKKIIYLGILLNLFCFNIYGENQWKFAVGAGVASEQEEWKDIKTSSYIFPILSASYGNLSIISEHGIVSYKFDIDEGINSYIGINIRNDAYNESGNPFKKSNESKSEIFKYYKSPKNEIILNLGVNFYRMFNFNLSQQINEDKDVTKITLVFSYPIYRNERGMSINTSYSPEFFNREYTNRYYSVKTPDLEYKGDSGLNHKISFALRYPISEALALSYSANIKFLDSTIYNSPLVDRRYTYGNALTLLYFF